MEEFNRRMLEVYLKDDPDTADLILSLIDRNYYNLDALGEWLKANYLDLDKIEKAVNAITALLETADYFDYPKDQHDRIQTYFMVLSINKSALAHISEKRRNAGRPHRIDGISKEHKKLIKDLNKGEGYQKYWNRMFAKGLDHEALSESIFKKVKRELKKL